MKNYWIAIVLALLFGFFGLQEFYVKRLGCGILAILFCWTFIPSLVALCEIIIWLFKGEDYFNKKFNNIENNKPLND